MLGEELVVDLREGGTNEKIGRRNGEEGREGRWRGASMDGSKESNEKEEQEQEAVSSISSIDQKTSKRAVPLFISRKVESEVVEVRSQTGR